MNRVKECNRVKERRVALGMRLEELAAKSGISMSFLFQIESNEPPEPSLFRSRAIAMALGTTVDWLWPVADSRREKVG